jgi:hypothetical protein
MAGKWKEVVRLTFKGARFRDHALDLRALSDLSQFQKMVAETAKTLWRAANPDRELSGEPQILTVNAYHPILRRGYVCV